MRKTLLLIISAIFIFATSANAVMWSGYAKLAKQQVYRVGVVVKNLKEQQASNPQLYYNNFDSSGKEIDLAKKTQLTKFIGSNVMTNLNKKAFTYKPETSSNQFKICNVLDADSLHIDTSKKEFIKRMFANNPNLPATSKYDSKSDCLTVYYATEYSLWLSKKDDKNPANSSQDLDKDGCLKTIYSSKVNLINDKKLKNIQTGTCAYIKNSKDSTKVDVYYYDAQNNQWLLWNVGDGGLSKDEIIALIEKYSKGGSNQCSNGLLLKVDYLGQPVSTSSLTPDDGFGSSSSSTQILAGASFYSNSPSSIKLVDIKNSSYQIGGECDSGHADGQEITLSYDKTNKKFYFNIGAYNSSSSSCTGDVSTIPTTLKAELYTSYKQKQYIYDYNAQKWRYLTYDFKNGTSKICISTFGGIWDSYSGDKCYSYKITDCTKSNASTQTKSNASTQTKSNASTQTKSNASTQTFLELYDFL